MRPFVLILLLALSTAACSARQTPAVPPTPVAVTVVPTATTSPTSLPTVVATSVTTPPRPPEPTAAGDTTPAPTATPPAMATISPDDARAAAAAELAGAPPPADAVRLAIAYRGLNPALPTAAPPDMPRLGDVETFTVRNVDNITDSQITARLLSISDTAYFWFDQAADVEQPDAAELDAIAAQFDDIYATLYAEFGVSAPPGGKAHIVNVSPASLCITADSCGLAGYFNSVDLLPRAVNPQSNERAMFVMNARQYGSGRYLDVLAHELRHMLGAGYDTGDEDWFIEGAATLAQDLVGFSTGPQERGRLFLQNPDQQLNSWSDNDTLPHYGQGYLVNRFLYDRLGAELYDEYATSPAVGLGAVDGVAAAHGLDVTGEGLWRDWLVAMAVHDNADAPERYRWGGPALEPVATTPVDSTPATFETTVSQYAADYYELPSSGAYLIDFAGAPAVSLLGAGAPSGEHIWVAQRANDSNPRLTRAVDLRNVDEATLTYRVFADIERGYDFAYVSVSTDGGERWQALTAEHMQGLSPDDDPSGSALTERFYSGRTRAWVEESIDLTPFAGQEILLRFEVVTDLILSYAGLALDDIAIPAIGFADDAETLDAGWLAEGFVRATATLPQTWPLQLVTFDGDEQPTVQALPVGADGRVQFVLETTPGGRRPVLIVAATAPDTLQPASYTLRVGEP